MSYQIIKYPKYDNNKYIKDIIEEDNMDNNNNDEDSFFLLSDKHKIPSLKLNLKKVNMQPEKISINDNKNKSENKKGSKVKLIINVKLINVIIINVKLKMYQSHLIHKNYIWKSVIWKNIIAMKNLYQIFLHL